jgi:hypothetical protein
MTQRRVTNNQAEDAAALMSVAVASGRRRGESQIRDEERYRMAAFRIREAANRIATLANGAPDPALRRELLAVCERLLGEERTLLALTAQR